MRDSRVAAVGLGDTFTPSGLKIPTVCTPSTDFRADGFGRLRSYVRICNPGGAFISVQKTGCTPDGPVPTSEEWAEIDKQRAAAGYSTIGCLVTKKSSNFIDVAARRTAVVTAPLDRYVPGWAVVVNIILTPLIPIIPLILSSLNDAIALVGSGLGGLIPAPILGGTVQQTIAHEIIQGGLLVAQAGVQGTAILATALGPIAATIVKATVVAKTTRGGVLKKIAAVSLEITNEIALALKIASVVASAGGTLGLIPATVIDTAKAASEVLSTFNDAYSALSNVADVVAVLSTAGGALHTIAAAKDAADAAKKSAKLAKQAAQAELARLAAEQRALDAEIARLQRELAAAPPGLRTVAPMPAPVARAAAPVQSMSNGARALLAGALALALAEVLE